MAPITSRAWKEIDEAVRAILVTSLCGRKVVDVVGPKGIQEAAINLGRLDVPKQNAKNEVLFGIRQTQPLVEGRATFKLDIWNLDDIERGATAIDLGAAEKAALAMASFEDNAIFNGFKPGGINGLTQLKAHKPVPLKLEPKGLLEGLAKAVLALSDGAVQGPYNLVVGPDAFKALSSGLASGYPLRKQVTNLIGGAIHYSSVLDGALLVATRGGDFELTLGLDFAVGFDSREDRNVVLYITESFTFRVLDPAACLYLPPVGK
jgi:uncharacterized linocin/CFP29 family protein